MKAGLRAALVLAATTALQAVRNRVLALGVGFSVALIAASLVAASVALGERARLIVDIGLAAQSALGALMAAGLTIAAFSADLRRRTAYAVLARPVPRWSFVLGKYLGVIGAMAAVLALMTLATLATLWSYGGAPTAAFWGSVWLTFGEVCVVTAVAVLFATLTGPVLAAAYTAGVFIAGNLSEDLRLFAARAAEDGAGAAAHLLEAAYYVLPDLQLLSLRAQAANGLDVPEGFVAHGTLYAVCYAAAVVALAMVSLTRRRSIG